MIQSFITIALRILWRNKVTSFVNIFSLSIGVTSFIFIMLYVHHETNYDKFNKNCDRIYRLEGDDYAKLPPVIGDYIKDRIPEIRNVVHFAGSGKSDITYRPDGNPEGAKYTQTDVLWADSTTFDVFTFPFIRGKAATTLTNPFKAVITEETAKILFGQTDPMGKSIEFSEHQFEVTGIIRNPEKSHIEIGVLVSMTSLPLVYPDRDLNNTGPNSWLWSATYLLTANDVDVMNVEKKINEVLKEINDGKLFNTVFKQFRLRPLKEIYFYGALQNLDYGLHGSYKLISILFIIGIFMLVLACINYVNLTTARSIIRTKEVAIKRFIGSSITLVRFQLILESVIVSVISLIVALTAAQIFIHAFNDVAMVKIDLGHWNHIDVWFYIFCGTITVGVVAGIYPALYLTAVKPIKLIKGVTAENASTLSPRSLLMTFQFTLSIVLMICAMASLRQLTYLRHANLGFNKEQIIQIETPDTFEQVYVLRESFREELLQLNNILGVCFAAGTPGGHIPTIPVDLGGERRPLDALMIDQDYLDVMNIELVEGRSFPDRPLKNITEIPYEKNPVVVNESFVREFDLVSPIGTVFRRDDPRGKRSFEIIGVVKDFHFRSLHHKISPFMSFQTPPMHIAHIKVQPANLPATIKAIEKVWKKVYGDKPFTFSFLDETFNRQYRSDEQLATVIAWFTGLTLVIACLGLFALSSFMITRRTKEIGIRKSMGASIRSIYTMLSWDFLKWIVVAVVIACPVAWYLMQLWLSKFAYHVELGTDVFIIAAVSAIGVALLTVTWQSLKAANANAIKSLRYE
jgi:putative ABC transport system permease protein